MDLISFEDLVVQPYNSYFSLEKELHEVKSQLSLMEQRLKYLDEKKPKKPKKKRHVKQEDTDVKEYEIIEKKIQNDSDRKQRLTNRNEVRKKNEELQLKRKEEWEKWDKEREEEVERRKKNEEEHERKKNENEKYWNSRHEYWKKIESNTFTYTKKESNGFAADAGYYYSCYDVKLERKKSVEEYLKRNVDDTYLNSVGKYYSNKK